jgi:hypothetical protein
MPTDCRSTKASYSASISEDEHEQVWPFGVVVSQQLHDHLRAAPAPHHPRAST